MKPSACARRSTSSFACTTTFYSKTINRLKFCVTSSFVFLPFVSTSLSTVEFLWLGRKASKVPKEYEVDGD
ncbi:hypothetical protein P8452_02686 [Trifolium repens]|nr:hypothetical protein P8452_02686 [Trifolium repens]